MTLSAILRALPLGQTKAIFTMTSGPRQEADNELVLSFLAVRRALGLLGFALPASLVLYGVLSGEGIQPSISEFYFTSAGDLLVGTLTAIGVFLLAYVGFDRRTREILSDFWVSRIAAMGALGVAFIPTSEPAAGPELLPEPIAHRWLGAETSQYLHYGSATVFFAGLALFCLVLFRRNDPAVPMTPDKIYRNRIYLICGILIVAVMALLFAFFLYRRTLTAEAQAALDSHDIVFYLETLGILAFSVSWLTKGRALVPIRRMIKPPDSSPTARR